MHECWKDLRAGTCTTPSIACLEQNERYRVAYATIAKGEAIEPVVVEDMLVGGFGSARGVAVGAAERFFEGTRYSERVLGQMKSGDFHGFPQAVEALAGSGAVSLVVQPSTGAVKQMLQIPGSYGGRDGVFEFIKHESGVIYHRLFRPN